MILKVLATVGLLAAPSFDQWQREQDYQDRLRCEHLLRMQGFAKDTLAQAITRYSQCIETPGILGCSAEFGELIDARKQYKIAINDATDLCVLPGMADDTPEP